MKLKQKEFKALDENKANLVYNILFKIEGLALAQNFLIAQAAREAMEQFEKKDCQ